MSYRHLKNSTIPSYKKQMIQQIENYHLKTLNKHEYKSLLTMEQWKEGKKLHTLKHSHYKKFLSYYK